MRALALSLCLAFAAMSAAAGERQTPSPAGERELDRLAYAVDGAESSHGADAGMWRGDADGPQGPMQVSAAAAIDVGGGDRFDLDENRALGRAYLAHLYHRYGNWPDALAAYNWGPRRLDAWISSGRAEQRPASVERYIDRVLHDGGFGSGGFGAMSGRVMPIRIYVDFTLNRPVFLLPGRGPITVRARLTLHRMLARAEYLARRS